ncbi:MAG: FAD-dependent oxidoreductase [Desulfobacteraceae bacterium]|jgi:NADPH-dependent 2,4-dienoyl-CoA reductase/sulfur reductase-like enzyme/rhodanese-related sulfurtransferase
MSDHKVVVIGGVACGPKAAARIKRLNPKADVTLIEKGELLSYSGCGMPFYISGEVHDHNELMQTPVGVVRDTHFFKVVKDINVYNRTVAEKIDREKKIVHALKIDTGEKIEFPYDDLVLATGSETVRPPIPGIDLKGVNILSTIEDARKIKDRVSKFKGKNAVIIGGGLIGIEVTEAFVKQGMHVTVIEKEDQLLKNLTDPEISIHVRRELQRNGVKLAVGQTVTEIKGDDSSEVSAVVTEKETFPADIVLVSIGVKPNVKLAKDCGLEIGVTGGIVTDEHMRTTDKSIYAGGDCAENRNRLTNDVIYTPMGSTANKQGRVIGDNICGRSTKFPGVLGTAICKVFDLTIARTGLTEKECRQKNLNYVTVLTPSPDKPHFLPDAKLIIIKLIAENPSGKILGCQVTGYGEAAKRLDIAVAAMSHNATVYDLEYYDLAYAPPYSPAMDNIIVAANIAENKITNTGMSCTPSQVKDQIENGKDFVFLDVRSPQEYEMMRIEDERVKLLPLGALREKISELPKDREIVAFCKISLRGYEAQRILEGEGFTNVKYMDGGVLCWPYEKYVKS